MSHFRETKKQPEKFKAHKEEWYTKNREENFTNELVSVIPVQQKKASKSKY